QPRGFAVASRHTGSNNTREAPDRQIQPESALRAHRRSWPDADEATLRLMDHSKHRLLPLKCASRDHQPSLVGESVRENNTVENLARPFQAAKDRGFGIFISPHYFYPTDQAWQYIRPTRNLLIAPLGPVISMISHDSVGQPKLDVDSC